MLKSPLFLITGLGRPGKEAHPHCLLPSRLNSLFKITGRGEGNENSAHPPPAQRGQLFNGMAQGMGGGLPQQIPSSPLAPSSALQGLAKETSH